MATRGAAPRNPLWDPPTSTQSHYLPKIDDSAVVAPELLAPRLPREMLLAPIPVLLLAVVAAALLIATSASIESLLWLALATAAMTALAMLLGGWMARLRHEPIAHLAREMQRLSNGDLDVQLALTGDGALGQLQQGINATASALRSGLGQLDQQIRRATTLRARNNAEFEAARVE
ncbi:HAMP domain-containing protein [Hydrocarboniphaga sp.]|uniref:HAMP domain-containing protein n=1 Tax=Hydrocarboniphaga sp. TaxID=2033016 RepID=UPI003D0F8266